MPPQQQQKQQMHNLLSPSYRLERFDYNDDDDDEAPFLDLTESQLGSLSFSFEEEEEGSNTSRSDLPERKISFSDSLEEVFEITPILECSDSFDDGDDDEDDDLRQLLQQNSNEIWYKRSEMKIFRRQRDVLSKRLQQLQRHKSVTQQQQVDDEDCIEGLETTCKDKVKSVVKAVLSEQQERSETSSSSYKDDDDPMEYLSCISQSLSSLSVEEAVNRGLRLQHDIVDSL